MRVCLLFLAVIAGCDRPSPLGTFSRDDLAKWAGDCESSIVEDDPHDPRTPGPKSRDRGTAFARATRRYRCPPPGWAVYTDKRNQVVGFCVDDDTRSSKHQGKWISEIDRARALITAHWGSKRAEEMLKGTSGDLCSVTSESVADDMLRWSADQDFYPNPENVYSHVKCCWEVRD
jgi:hypothetical protein